MADLEPKGEGAGTRVIWRKLDWVNPNLQKMQSTVRRKDA
jgi:hypothetical protein